MLSPYQTLFLHFYINKYSRFHSIWSKVKFRRSACHGRKSQDSAKAKAVADKVIFIDQGKIVEEAAPEEFFEHPKTERAKQFLNVFTFEQVEHHVE